MKSYMLFSQRSFWIEHQAVLLLQDTWVCRFFFCDRLVNDTYAYPSPHELERRIFALQVHYWADNFGCGHLEHSHDTRHIDSLLTQKNKKIKTVVNKLDQIDTRFRFFKMELIAGEPDYIVTHVCHFSTSILIYLTSFL
jgi:hypothetical protein